MDKKIGLGSTKGRRRGITGTLARGLKLTNRDLNPTFLLPPFDFNPSATVSKSGSKSTLASSQLISSKDSTEDDAVGVSLVSCRVDIKHQ